MFKGAALFAVCFILIAPQSREFLGSLITHTGESLNSWSPYSYVAIGLLVAAPLLSILLIKTWPQRADTANPMAKYRRDLPYED